MTEQEEIRMGRAGIIIKKLIDTTSLESPEINNLAFELNKEIEDYEDSQGVVIKVLNEGQIKLRHTKQSVGWITYEPLIEEK